ncbi:hypothetical protein NMK34_10750 [Micromonospora sp. BRA006-A]|uniref:hypothetical protein n=1 Tax=Micromonospora sp. BRA006-A TaxID=2962860 RepID=UPI00296EBB4B|nr:hypothetical protein [Micromonospora sp. BRA006-A]MDW3847079.1 hypothetical protein [Micromonospora sp. BRA006-A]MEE3920579.1 hypothetical protein [Micromonospora sp. BRA006-A]
MPTSSPTQGRPPRAIRPHVAIRPLWLCRVCAGPWPCQPARLLLLLEYRRDRVALSIYMAGCLFDAAADLLRLNPDPGPRPGELFHRFVAWTRHS